MSSLRNFGIAFIAALLIFSGTAYLALGYVSDLFTAESEKSANEGPGSQIYEGPVNNTVEVIKTGRSFNVVIVGTDYDPEIYSDYEAPKVNDNKLYVIRKIEATAILFVRFDKEMRALRICSIPVQTAVSVDHVPMTLGQAYGYKGVEYIRERVASYVGMSVDFIMEFSGREFAEFTQKKLLSHDFTVPISVTTTEEKGLQSMTFTEGQTVVGVNAIYTLLHHTNYALPNINDRNKLLESFFLQTISKLTVTNNPTVYYNTFISAIQTDMTQQDVTELIEVLYTLPLYIGANETPTVVSTVEFYKCGSYMSDGTFEVDQNAVRAAFNFEK